MCQSRKYETKRKNVEIIEKNSEYFFSELRKLMESSGKLLWVGMRCSLGRVAPENRVCRYLNGERVFAHEKQGNTLLYHFKGFQPDGDGECAHFVPSQVDRSYNEGLNDFPCSRVHGWGLNLHGLCEIKKDFYI